MAVVVVVLAVRGSALVVPVAALGHAKAVRDAVRCVILDAIQNVHLVVQAVQENVAMDAVVAGAEQTEHKWAHATVVLVVVAVLVIMDVLVQHVGVVLEDAVLLAWAVVIVDVLVLMVIFVPVGEIVLLHVFLDVQVAVDVQGVRDVVEIVPGRVMVVGLAALELVLLVVHIVVQRDVTLLVLLRVMPLYQVQRPHKYNGITNSTLLKIKPQFYWFILANISIQFNINIK